MKKEVKENSLVWLTLITSSSTLLCCTLPVIFVALGFGAALVTLTSQLPWWIALAEHKFWLFLTSSLLLLITYWTLTRSERNCPLDPALAERCKRLLRWNFWVFRVSLIIWLIGFFSAYLAAPLAYWLGF